MSYQSLIYKMNRTLAEYTNWYHVFLCKSHNYREISNKRPIPSIFIFHSRLYNVTFYKNMKNKSWNKIFLYSQLFVKYPSLLFEQIAFFLRSRYDIIAIYTKRNWKENNFEWYLSRDTFLIDWNWKVCFFAEQQMFILDC